MSNATTPPQGFWEAVGRWAIIALLAFTVYYAQKLEDRIESHDAAIMALSVDKVSRQELKELENRLNLSITTIKSDILERMDWHFNRSSKK